MKIYNSLTQSKEAFVPIESGRIGLYACGMTVYDYCHLGHARSLLVFDLLVRYWRFRGYRVNYVRNITDIDDKIIARAQQNNESWEALTARFIEAMHEDERALGILPPDHEPQATQYLPQIIALIEKIMASGHAYVADNGDVCFEIARFSDYGKLSKRDVEKLIAGARVDVSAGKRSPADFVLWKLVKPGEPCWDSPWGEGRPGWHIECSAMSTDLLGQPFDIHGGGMDLKFPHHENEIAQSEAACQCEFARYWMHAGLLKIDGEKMSKSLGNFMTIRDALAQHDAEVIRFFMYSGSYRSPINYSDDNLHQARSSLERLYASVRGLPAVEPVIGSVFEQRFIEKMDDDVNTPEAMAVLFELSHEINRLREQDVPQAAALAQLLKQLAAVLGVLQHDPDWFLTQGADEQESEQIESLIEQRNQARSAKDWALADQLRDQLDAMGVSIEDTAQGTLWRKRG